MKLAIISVLAAALISGTASAADPIIEELDSIDYAMDGHDWNGFYFGVHAGYGMGSTFNDTVPPSADLSIPMQGWLAGLTGGANHQMGNFVLGVEGDISWSNIAGSAVCPNVAFMCDAAVRWLGTVRGRAGWAVDGALLFVTAGLAAGGVTTGSTPDVPGMPEYSGTHLGFVAGAGVELAVTDNMSIKAEYNFIRLSGTAPAGTIDLGPVAMTSTVHALKVGANWHF